MHSQNLHVITSLIEWLKLGEPVWLATIVETWGASPRPPGSLFAYNPSRCLQVGSLSGGCIEEDLTQKLRSKTPATKPELKIYGDTQADVEKFQLPCGGRMVIVLEYCTKDNVLSQFETISKRLCSSQRILRQVDMQSGDVKLDRLSRQDVSKDIELAEGVVRHLIGPEYKVLLVGVGEVTKYLVSILGTLDFAVQVCDSRESFIEKHDADSWGVDIVHCLPDDLVYASYHDEYSAIVTLAHDPRVDDLALMAAFESKAFYIGAMGSSRTTARRIERLEALGFESENMLRLSAPIGLEIGSKTPAEIAVSISAELIKKRNELTKKQSNHLQADTLCNAL